MSKKRRTGLRDEGEVVLSLNFTPDPPPPKYRIVIPATADEPEKTYNVILEPNENPELVNVFLENGAFVGTMTLPEKIP